MSRPLDRLRFHVSGAIARGEAVPIAGIPVLPLCPECIGAIGGACGGPDAPYRPAKPGEPCGAADHDDGEPDAYEVWNATGEFPK